eukprot:2271994-Amphidinium_carterae.1
MESCDGHILEPKPHLRSLLDAFTPCSRAGSPSESSKRKPPFSRSCVKPECQTVSMVALHVGKRYLQTQHMYKADHCSCRHYLAREVTERCAKQTRHLPVESWQFFVAI